MRSGKGLLALAVVLAGLVAYLYFVDAKKPVTEPGVEQHDKVFTLEADKVEQLQITSSSGDVTTLRKEKGSWQMTAPAAAAVDDSAVSAITSNLASIEKQGVVDEKPSDLHQYGLKDPRVTVAFKTAGDKDFTRLLLGSKTPTGGDTYAKLGASPAVFLIPSYTDSTFDKKPFDLRDKSVLKIERDKIDTVHLQYDKTTIDLAKNGLDWNLTSPVKARADFSAAEGLVSRVQSAQMKSLVTDHDPKLDEYGLTDPAAAITVGAGSTRATLAIGKAAADGDLYARDLSRPDMIFTVGSDLATDLKKSVFDLRRKDLFEFRSFNTDRLEITRGSETFTFEKSKSSGSDGAEKWHRTTPTKGDVDTAKMESLLSKLSSLRAESFVDGKMPAALDHPVLTVSARFDDGKKQERVQFGRAGNDVFASRPDEPGAARVNAKEFDEAVQALDAVK
jgi:hypothetical protein